LPRTRDIEDVRAFFATQSGASVRDLP
jgi:hypothetical protein